MPAAYSKSVFINCAFDDGFSPIFRAVIFAVLDCGFVPRSALEYQDSGDIRVEKIGRIIEQSGFGIHDISKAELDPASGLPRFNMPFELGLFLGAKRFGGDRRQKGKRRLIMDSDPHRYTIFFTDIRGQDPESHDGDPVQAISVVRNWLDHARRTKTQPLPGGNAIAQRHQRYQDNLPELAAGFELEPAALTYKDEVFLIEKWPQNERAIAGL